METTNKSRIRLKDGRLFEKGKTFKVIPSVDRPDYGAICFPKPKGAAFKLPYHRLPALFNDFHAVTQEELELAIMDSYCPSITGEDVEPDGHDSEGFPSWLIALGLI